MGGNTSSNPDFGVRYDFQLSKIGQALKIAVLKRLQLFLYHIMCSTRRLHKIRVQVLLPIESFSLLISIGTWYELQVFCLQRSTSRQKGK
jgi:hypothetical protein